MQLFTAWITPRDGVPRRTPIAGHDIDHARWRTCKLALKLYGCGFTYCVRRNAKALLPKV